MTLLLAAVTAAAEAREVYPLDEGWRFYFKEENTSDNARHVTLPHSWNTDPQRQGSWLETTGNYRNDIFIPAGWSSRRLFLKFYGVQSVADLFVNGRHVGTHRGGAAAFTFEITDYVQFGMDNALLVVVSNSARNDVLPTSTEMNLYGGIYRDVELIVTGPTAVSPLYLGSDGVLVHPREIDSLHASGEVEVHLTSNRESSCTLTLDITAPDGSTVFTRRQRARLDGKPVVVPFAIDAPELWSRETPALYTVTAAIGEDSIVDCVRVRTGFRSLAATPGGGLQMLMAAHNNTYFHTLGQVQPGSRVTLEMYYGSYEYEVTESFVGRSSDSTVYDLQAGEEKLILYTCYPFDQLTSTPYRFFVYCQPVSGRPLRTD